MTSTTQSTDIKTHYLAEFERQAATRRAGVPDWLNTLRSRAIERFAELGFPDLRDENWRHTSLRPLTRVAFTLPDDSTPYAKENSQGNSFFLDGEEAARIVFINGRPAPSLGAMSDIPSGVVIATLAEALKSHGALVERHLAQYASWKDHPFAALNTAFMNDGAFINIPKGVNIERPIHLVFLSTARDQPQVTHPRNLIIVDESSRVNIIETYAGLDSNVYFTNAVSEIVVDENAAVDHCRIQRESESAFHFATQENHLRRNANFTSHNLAFGGALVRNDINVSLNDENIECLLHGLYLPRGAQHIDNHTRMDHAKPHCHSYELYKGILDDKASGVFNGRIIVRPDAQKTDAVQANHTLLLTEAATINTRPQLEIFADDVKCTHGATVGELDEDAIFYLRSRGINKSAARAMLIAAFANEIIEPIKSEPLRALLYKFIETRFHQSHNVEGI